MTYEPTRARVKTLARIRAGHVSRAQAEIDIVCWVCGVQVRMTRPEGRALGWKIGKMRSVRRGLREQVDLCPRCDLGKGLADRGSAADDTPR